MFTRIEKEGNMRNELDSLLPEKWRADHLNGVQVVGGSNPLTPTITYPPVRIWANSGWYSVLGFMAVNRFPRNRTSSNIS